MQPTKLRAQAGHSMSFSQAACLHAGGVPASTSELLDQNPLGLTMLAATRPGMVALQGRVMLQFRNMADSLINLVDRPCVGVPAYADALMVCPLMLSRGACKLSV